MKGVKNYKDETHIVNIIEKESNCICEFNINILNCEMIYNDEAKMIKCFKKEYQKYKKCMVNANLWLLKDYN